MDVDTLSVLCSASDSQSVEITSPQLIVHSLNYVKTRQPLSWRVESVEGSGHVIPFDTNFKWIVVPFIGKPHPWPLPSLPPSTFLPAESDDPGCSNTLMEEGDSPQYNLTLTCWGPYQLTVIGNHSAGSFVKGLQFTAEGKHTTAPPPA